MSFDRLRVVSLNAWKNEGDLAARLPAMIEGLNALAPDIVCLQEAFAAHSLGVDVARQVAAALGFVPHVLEQRVKDRNHDGRRIASASNLATLARMPLRTSRIELPMAEADGQRCGQMVHIVGGPRLLNLHLTHLLGDVGATLRARQIQTALQAAGEGVDVLVVGDLNAAADAPELDGLFGQPVDRGPDQASADAPTMRSARAAIDHIVLLRPTEWRIVGCGRALADAHDGTWPSDHLAVTADLERRA